MAYDFLGLVNDLNERVNETPLTTSNFSSAQGFYSTAKQAVNSSIRHINTQQFEWPFNHVTFEGNLSEGTTRYPYPYDAKTVDFDTFRIPADSGLGNSTKKLSILTYEDYLENYVDHEYSPERRSLPWGVFRTPDGGFGVVPTPDQDYPLVYEYFQTSFDLILPTDVPDIPEQFRHVITDGAMYYVYMFRNSGEEAQVTYNLFTQGLKSMRSLYVNRYDYLRDTVIEGRFANPVNRG